MRLGDGKMIHHAAIRHQCARPYLYGKDGQAEAVLADVEAAASRAIEHVIASERPLPPEDDRYASLLLFIAVHARVLGRG